MCRPDLKTLKQILNVFGLAAALCLIVGCATQSKEATQSGPVATCYVCRYNNDLSCVNIRVKDGTPRTEYHGRDYFFCSEDCRDAFLKKPEKYLSKSESK